MYGSLPASSYQEQYNACALEKQSYRLKVHVQFTYMFNMLRCILYVVLYMLYTTLLYYEPRNN